MAIVQRLTVLLGLSLLVVQQVVADMTASHGGLIAQSHRGIRMKMRMDDANKNKNMMAETANPTRRQKLKMMMIMARNNRRSNVGKGKGGASKKGAKGSKGKGSTGYLPPDYIESLYPPPIITGKGYYQAPTTTGKGSFYPPPATTGEGYYYPPPTTTGKGYLYGPYPPPDDYYYMPPPDYNTVTGQLPPQFQPPTQGSTSLLPQLPNWSVGKGAQTSGSKGKKSVKVSAPTGKGWTIVPPGKGVSVSTPPPIPPKQTSRPSNVSVSTEEPTLQLQIVDSPPPVSKGKAVIPSDGKGAYFSPAKSKKGSKKGKGEKKGKAKYYSKDGGKDSHAPVAVSRSDAPSFVPSVSPAPVTQDDNIDTNEPVSVPTAFVTSLPVALDTFQPSPGTGLGPGSDTASPTALVSTTEDPTMSLTAPPTISGAAVRSSPFAVEFTLSSADVPSASDFNEAADVTIAFLNDYFVALFDLSDSTILEQFTGFQIGTAEPSTIGFETVLMFDLSSTLIPEPFDIDNALETAFSPPTAQTLLQDLSALDASNPFSTANAVGLTYSDVPDNGTMTTQQDGPTTLTVALSVVGAVAVGATIIAAGTLMMLRRQGPMAPTSKTPMEVLEEYRATTLGGSSTNESLQSGLPKGELEDDELFYDVDLGRTTKETRSPWRNRRPPE